MGLHFVKYMTHKLRYSPWHAVAICLRAAIEEPVTARHSKGTVVKGSPYRGR